MRSLPKSLKFKVGVYLAVALSLAMATFTAIDINHERDQLQQEAINRVTQLSEVITRSTRYAMLQNQSDYVYRIIQDVGKQDGIAKVRVFSKDGRITHSTLAGEIGGKVDRTADGCVACHQSDRPLEHVAQSKRARIYPAPAGGRLLGSMEVIRNEPSCYNAACHVHTPAQAVLGVLDIVYSLDEIDQSLWRNTLTVAGGSAAFVFLVSLLVSVFVHRLVYVPLRDLQSGARRLAAGELDQAIPVRSTDEFGQLAGSFNTMTAAIRESRAKLEESAHTLEQKVQQRTQELRVAQAEAVRGEKLASVGLLAAGVAHELNNPLTGVLTFSHLLRQKMPDGSQDAEDLDLVIRETKRCAAIIRRLLDFAREKKPEKKYADLNALIEETERIVERPAHLRDIAITMELDPALPKVWVDADQIKQVVMNMLVNAQHALEGKREGTITIRTRRAGARCPEPGVPAVPMVEIAIADTGCGIAAGDLSRVFDPFFTTKEVGKGTGLGLSVSHGIVRAHGGLIEVESTLGAGTTFRVFLPLAPRAEDKSEPEALESCGEQQDPHR
ncbi:MAG TPA: ATP-binding protein [Burkholderiaceae bacterium]|nr:ATP-binding protein [Burkholderiaceae bacterium]